jgi:tetrapyrrole methylase family protein/MazG family protein
MAMTILGLGPGDPQHLTLEAWNTLESADEIFVRTLQHPTVGSLPNHLDVKSFDRMYEGSDTFDEVYESIAKELIHLARRPQGVLYGVPGHPMVAEQSVSRALELAGREGIETRVVPGMSFLEPAATALGLDLLDVQLADATDLIHLHHPGLRTDRGVIIGQLYSDEVASDLKLLLMMVYPDDHSVTLARAAGVTDEETSTMPLYQMDRQAGIDHLTALYVPPLDGSLPVVALQELAAHLRSPEGCPWDREQTRRSLRPCLLEETYEVLDALDEEDSDELRSELGDLLFQIVLHAQLGAEAGEFTLEQIVDGIVKKLVRRHPHVFGEVSVSGAEEVVVNWEEIKRHEHEHPRGLLDSVPKDLPSLAKAQGIQRKVARVGFDWPDLSGVLDKVSEEIGELREAEGAVMEENEMGDLLFALANLARWMNIDAESALREANLRFIRRFERMDELCKIKGERLQDLPLEEQDKLWEQAKAELD